MPQPVYRIDERRARRCGPARATMLGRTRSPAIARPAPPARRRASISQVPSPCPVTASAAVAPGEVRHVLAPGRAARRRCRPRCAPCPARRRRPAGRHRHWAGRSPPISSPSRSNATALMTEVPASTPMIRSRAHAAAASRAARPCCSAVPLSASNRCMARRRQAHRHRAADRGVDAPCGHHDQEAAVRGRAPDAPGRPATGSRRRVAGRPCGSPTSDAVRADAELDRAGRRSPPAAVASGTRNAGSPGRVERQQLVGASADRDIDDVHRRLADEARDEQVGRLLLQLGRRRVLLQDALLHHRDPVGQRDRLGLVVGDEHGRHLVLDQIVLDPRAQDRAQLRLELGHRLVEQRERRRAGPRRGRGWCAAAGRPRSCGG